MKRKITLLLLAAGSVLTMNSQVILQEEFTASTFVLNTGTGWSVQNLSQPSNTVSWAQGNGTGGNNGTSAYSGGTNDFYCADFLSIPDQTAGGISAWLISPSVPIYNGAVIQFATRTLSFTAPNIFPDRMQVRWSPDGNLTIGTGSTAVGTFTNMLLDINPAYSTANSSVVAGGTVNGYPMSWTVYTLQITNAPATGTVNGRFAFRYFVDNGGATGTRSRFIGVDQFKYTGPCGTSVQSFTTCANQPVTLQATGGLPATTYSWTGPGGAAGTTQSISVTSPASGTAIYTLAPSNGAISCNITQTAAVTVSTNLVVNVSSSAATSTICSGRSITLTATGPGTSYLWTSGVNSLGSTAVITVTPNTTTTYSVGSASGSCIGGNAITINVIPTPTITYAVAPDPLCIGVNATVTSSGASTYTYIVGTQVVAANPIQIPSTLIPNDGLYQIQVVATGTNGCVAGGFETIEVLPNPTITVASASVICPNNRIDLDFSGADTYTTSGAGITTSTANPYSYGASTGVLTTGLKTFTITGIDADGCKGTSTYTLRVAPCTGIESLDGNMEASIFPNPFANELKVSGLAGNIEIYNALGQVVVKATVTEAQTISTAELAKGVYILKAFDKEGDLVKTVKLLKN